MANDPLLKFAPELSCGVQRYCRVRAESERLCAPLSPEDSAAQSMVFASPAKWHLAHTSWFFETFLLQAELPRYRAFHPRYRVMFNSYYNTIGAQHPRPERGLITRPSLAEVMDYRAYVDEHMEQLLDSGLDTKTRSLVELGLHHEQQHQELILMDIKHLFYCNPLLPAYHSRGSGADRAPARSLGWCAYPGGNAAIGHSGDAFAFDNESPRHPVCLAPFELADRLVTNGEYREFIEDDGYRRPELWLSDGWDRLHSENWQAPLYWRRSGDQWQVFGLAGSAPLVDSDPVMHVSYFEADAYATWANARLPTEQEWEHVAARGTRTGNFMDQGLFEPRPPATDANSDAPQQLFGDVWEWTRSAYTPYPGYRPSGGALGEYNGKFMCNQMVLRGGSCVTPSNHIRLTYRNFFQPEHRWQFGGIRLARDGKA